jgi:hypothetical protein
MQLILNQVWLPIFLKAHIIYRLAWLATTVVFSTCTSASFDWCMANENRTSCEGRLYRHVDVSIWCRIKLLKCHPQTRIRCIVLGRVVLGWSRDRIGCFSELFPSILSEALISKRDHSILYDGLWLDLNLSLTNIELRNKKNTVITHCIWTSTSCKVS